MRIVWLNLALLAIMILASRLALVIHEVGGHAVPAWFLGAKSVDIRLSPLGGGFVSPAFAAPPGPAGNAVFCLGGIALNLLTGAAAWIAARRLKTRGLAHIGLLFLGVGSVGGAIVYLSNGLYYGSGDPVGLAPRTEDIRHLQWAWILFVPAGAALAWAAVRHYLDFLSGHAELGSARRRIGLSAATVGAVALSYFGLWLALRDPDIEGSTSSWRLEIEIAKETERRVAAQQALQPTPEAPPTTPAFPVVRPEEVAHRVPKPVGPIVLYATAVLAGLLSAARARPAGVPATLKPAWALDLAALAAFTVLGFRFLG